MGDPGPAGATGATGTTGVTGATGATGTFEGGSSISSVAPDAVFVGRQHWITISGFNTVWTTDPSVNFSVSFCAGVTVDAQHIIVASPTALVVPITVAPTAALGTCTVTVTTDGDALTYEGAFELRSPLAVIGSSGDLAQGSIAYLWLQNLDFDNPWDGTQNSAGDYVYLQMDDMPGMTAYPADVQAFTMVLELFIDVNAAAGNKNLVIGSGDPSDPVAFPLPAAFAITARTPVALVANTAQTGHLDTSMSSKVYVYTPPAGDNRVTLTITSADAKAAPAFFLLGSTGVWEPVYSYASFLHWATASTSALYLIAVEDGARGNYDFSLLASADREPSNKTCATALALTAPTLVVGQRMEDTADEDWYKITTTSADANKFLQVQTLPGEETTYTQVSVIQGDCGNTPIETSDNLYNTWLGGLLTAGVVATPSVTYYIKVSYAPNPAGPPTIMGGNWYDLQVKLLGPEPTAGGTCATAAAVTLPFASTTPYLLTREATPDQDWFTFTTGAGDAGKALYVETLPGDLFTDTRIELLSGACPGTPITTSPIDDDFHEYYVSPALSASTTYFVRITRSVFANEGSALYNLTMELLPPGETEPNDTCATANTVTLPFQSATELELSSETDQDWFKFTATAADVGKQIYVQTFAGDTYTDTWVDVLHGPSCTTLMSMGGPSADSGNHETFLSTPIYEAGTYYVRVAPSTYYDSTFGTYYNLFIALY
jgi:hypothetical protein